MPTVVITGSTGLIGSEAVRFYAAKGFTVLGVDNDLRRSFFGQQASTVWNRQLLEQECPSYRHYDLDIRDREAMTRLFSEFGRDVILVIHSAAQPSHDWAARDPETDFTINANGTLVLLECTRRFAPDAAFIFTSTNKVYGDLPNELSFVEEETRWELDVGHQYREGIDESMSVDRSCHSLFGVSKVAADLLVQEYGRYFRMKTACFRCGCITGPGHAGALLHGFLSFLMRCTITGNPYTVIGYKGKQVRDNLHSYDLVAAFDEFFRNPRVGEVYNMGGGRQSNCSVLEAIALCEGIAGQRLSWKYREPPRVGDHIWWISSTQKFRSHYPSWSQRYGIREILVEIADRFIRESVVPHDGG